MVAPIGARAAARAAGLTYVQDDAPGFRRRRVGTDFVYQTSAGRRVRDRDVLARIRALAIPPAWTDVWICARADGHVQAIGRDARGRKQYRYHAAWRARRDREKYARLAEFARALPSIRQHVARDLRQHGTPRDKVVALVVRLLEGTAIRVGNTEYARTNGSFGLTTLRNHHADVSRTGVRFRFRGKSGVARAVDLECARVARLVKQCRDLPGRTLFQYVGDDGRARPVGSADVNAYLRAASGRDFTAKDFRTWRGTVTAATALAAIPLPPSAAGRKRAVVDAVRRVAGELGNTPAVCRKSYVHPAVVEAFARGRTIATANDDREHTTGLTRTERAVVALLRRRAPASPPAPAPRAKAA